MKGQSATVSSFPDDCFVGGSQMGDHVELSVRDTGVGIPAPELSHIFKRFHRIRGTRSRTHEGTGIGLSLVQELVKMHGGEIQVQSVEGQGSVFTVAIPIGQGHLPKDDAILGKTLDGIITSWNKGAEKIYGYSEKEVVGQPVSILVSADRPEEAQEILSRLARGEVIDHYETVRRKKSGEEIHVSLTVSPIRNQEGKVVGASSVARDITDRKQIEHALRHANDQLHILSRRLFQVQEDERRHLALELHDRMGQELTAAKIDLQTAQLLTEPAAITRRLDDSIAVLERLIQHHAFLPLESQLSLQEPGL